MSAQTLHESLRDPFQVERDPEIQATVDRLRAAGCSAATVLAAERYADADAAFSAQLDRAYAGVGIPMGPQS